MPASNRKGRDFIARHGETVFNIARRMQGDHPPTPLTRAGFAQADAMGAALGGLTAGGTFMILGAAEALNVSPLFLLMGSRSVKGWYSGTSIDSQDTLNFSVVSGVRSMNEVYPLERAAEAYERMMSGKARFRVVLTTGN